VQSNKEYSKKRKSEYTRGCIIKKRCVGTIYCPKNTCSNTAHCKL